MCDNCLEVAQRVRYIPLNVLLKILAHERKEQFQVVKKNCPKE